MLRNTFRKLSDCVVLMVHMVKGRQYSTSHIDAGALIAEMESETGVSHTLHNNACAVDDLYLHVCAQEQEELYFKYKQVLP